MRRNATAVTCLERSVGWTGALKREKSFLRPVEGVVGRCWVADRYVALIWIGWSVAEVSCMDFLGDERFDVCGRREMDESGAA